MAFDEKITEIMRNIGIAENTLMAVQLELDAYEARATAAEAKVALLRDVPNHIWAEARDTEWDAGFNHAVKLFRAALETDNG